MCVRWFCLPVVVLFLAAHASMALGQSVWYIDDDAAGDPGPGDPTVSDPLEDGSAAHPFDAIQEGINAAGAGDEVVVLDGTYTGNGNRDLDFAGLAITVRSASGDPTTCIIDCQGGTHRGFHFHSGETFASRVSGLTIAHGSQSDGYGGGVYCRLNSRPTITNCVIQDSNAFLGGGVFCWSSDATFVDCVISGNRSEIEAGGLDAWDSHLTITGCVISGNRGGYYGGGVYCMDSALTMTNCAITNNTVPGDEFDAHGGGIYGDDSTLICTNCCITGNSAGVYGGGVVLRGDATFANCTIAHNTAGNTVGGISCIGSLVLTNSILWGCSPSALHVVGPCTITYSDVQGGASGEGNINVDPQFMGLSPVDDVPGRDALTGEVLDDGAYRLAAGSPCIDAGNSAGVPADIADLDQDGEVWERTPLDLARGPRFWDDPDTMDTGRADPPDYPAVVDMGAYEFLTGDFVFVDDDAPNDPGPGDPALSDPAEDGSVAHPFDAIQEGMEAAAPGMEVIVLDGTYSGTGNRDLDFLGKAITVRSLSGNPSTCVIECGGGGGNLHRGFHFHSGETSATAVADLTVTGGNQSILEGGAILCVGGSHPTIRHCRLVDNDAYLGGGLYCANSSPTLVDCTISEGAADFGGCVYCRESEPIFENCIISDGWASSGGGVFCNGSSAILIDCTIEGNTADCGSGGIECYSGSNAVLVGCTISGNSASQCGTGGFAARLSDPALFNCTIRGNTASNAGGGGVGCWGGAPVFTDCSISGNSAAEPGGGVYCSASNPTFANCVITGNTNGGVHCASGSPTIANSIIWDCSPDSITVESGTPVVAYSDIEGGWPGDGNINSAPQFVAPGYWDQDVWVEGDYHLQLGSPCIDAGNSGAVPADVADLDGDGDTAERTPLDFAGYPRFFNYPDTVDTGLPDLPDYPEVVDMGLHEVPPGDLNGDGSIDLEDYFLFTTCFHGVAVPVSGECEAADMDGDGDVDLRDTGILWRAFGLAVG